MDLNNTQNQIRQYLSLGNINLAIDLFNNYLTVKDLESDLIKDTLLIISERYIRVKTKNIRGAISAEEYNTEISKIISSILDLLIEMPLLRKRYRIENSKMYSDDSNNALTNIQIVQNEKIDETRILIIETSREISILIDELDSKKKELEKHSINKEELLREIEHLNGRIEIEHMRYNKLKEEYDLLKEEKSEVINLKNELKELRSKTEEQANIIKVLTDNFVYSKQSLDEKNSIIEKLRSEIDELKNFKQMAEVLNSTVEKLRLEIDELKNSKPWLKKIFGI